MISITWSIFIRVLLLLHLIDWSRVIELRSYRNDSLTVCMSVIIPNRPPIFSPLPFFIESVRHVRDVCRRISGQTSDKEERGLRLEETKTDLDKLNGNIENRFDASVNLGVLTPSLDPVEDVRQRPRYDPHLFVHCRRLESRPHAVRLPAARLNIFIHRNCIFLSCLRKKLIVNISWVAIHKSVSGSGRSAGETKTAFLCVSYMLCTKSMKLKQVWI